MICLLPPSHLPLPPPPAVNELDRRYTGGLEKERQLAEGRGGEREGESLIRMTKVENDLIVFESYLLLNVLSARNLEKNIFF